MRLRDSIAWLGCCFVFAVATAGAGGQTAAASPNVAGALQAGTQAEGVTTLHLSRREVVLDIVVTDRNKQPVIGLTRDQFHILEGKQEQRIVSFSQPAEHVAPLHAVPVRSAADLKKLGNVPINIVVLDELNTVFTDLAYGRSQLQLYLKKQPAVLNQPTTLLSVSDSNLRMLHDYTQDRDELARTATNHFPSLPFSMVKGGDDGTRLARCFGALLQIAQSTKGYAGRKNIIWIGKGFPSLDTSQENTGRGANDLAALKLVTTALLDARVTLNIIDPTPLSSAQADLSNPEMLTPSMLLQATGANGVALGDQVGDPTVISFFNFAPATGGLAFYARNDIDRQIATAIDDGAQYYTLTYAPTDQTSDDAFHAINVKLSDPNMVAWARNGYYREKTVAPNVMPSAPPVKTLAFDLTTAALATIAYSGLDVSAEKDKDAPLYKLAITPIGMAFRSSKSGRSLAEVTTMTVVFGKKQKVLSHEVQEVSQAVDATSEPFRFTLPAHIPAEAVRIRIVVRDALSGHLGTVDLSPNPDVPYDPTQAEAGSRKR